MVVEERPTPDWMKIPTILQHKFFKQAQEEAERCKHRLKERFERLNNLSQYIKSEPLPDGDQWRKWRVAVIDGSNSPATSERLGSRFGVYCAGYLIFEDNQPVEHGFEADEFVQDQIGSQDVAEKALSMLRILLERKIALECLEEKKADLVLIDGSFFGFRADAHRINDELLDVKGYHRGKDLTVDVRDKTLKLLKSDKAVGIIKRSRMSAIDGWLISRYGDESHCIHSNDKFILSLIMPPSHWFSYEWLFKPTATVEHLDADKVREQWSIAHHYYNTFRSIYRYKLSKGDPSSPGRIFDDAAQSLKRVIKKSLDIDHLQVIRTSRYFVKCSEMPPFELETPLDVDVKPLLSYFKAFHNPATGLPWPIDLVDENVTLPAGFTKEFVEEIEAELIRDPEVQDKIGLQAHFAPLNPQKPDE